MVVCRVPRERLDKEGEVQAFSTFPEGPGKC